MNETIMAFSALVKVVLPVVPVLVNMARKRDRVHEIRNLPFILPGSRIHIEELVGKGKGVLDKGKGLDLKRLKNLATTLTEGEIYGDIFKYISKHTFEENTNWDILLKGYDNWKKTLEDLISELSNQLSEKEKDKHHESQSSGPEKEGEMPPGNVRRCLFYLSRFPEIYVFNRKRISRLLVAHEFIAADSGEPPLQHLANWLKPAESIWDGDEAPNHFLLGDNVAKCTPKWPESTEYVREALAESIESIVDEYFCSYFIFRSSLILLGKRNYTLKLEEGQFLFLKVLSLRNGTLGNAKYLKTLSFLKYLDLKYSDFRNCSYLKDLEELEMLDLRYTRVEKIPEECLEKWGKLQHLLLGYHPNTNDNKLAGPELNAEKLSTKNLKTLRAIRRPGVNQRIDHVSKVADLSMTGLETGDLKGFWNVVKNFENLTSLGVAVTKDSDITLQDCPAKLKSKLKRLRMEGKFPISSTSAQPHSSLAELGNFTELIDLTLASHERINIDSIPKLSKLLCLRLYSFRTEKTLILRVQGLDRLKKLVIGDMKNVETIQIASDVIQTVDTLKLCNLPKFCEIICGESKSPPRLLSRRWERKTVPPHRADFFKLDAHKPKTIFLRGFVSESFEKSPSLKIYSYDMDKQCYQEVLNETT